MSGQSEYFRTGSYYFMFSHNIMFTFMISFQYIKSLLMKSYGRYWDLIKQYEIPLSRMVNDTLELDHMQ